MKTRVLESLRVKNYTSALSQITELIASDHSASTRAFAVRTIDAIAASSGLLAPVRLTILRSMTLEPISSFVKCHGARDGLAIHTTFGGYNQFEQALDDGQSILPDTTIVVIAGRVEDLAPSLANRFIQLGTEGQSSERAHLLGRYREWIERLTERTPATRVLVLGFELPVEPAFGLADDRLATGQKAFLRDINDSLAELCRNYSGVYYVDIDSVFANIGRKNAHDARMMAHARLPYSAAGLDALAEHIERYVAALVSARKKCIVLDCDNTLWGGVLGEDGFDGIVLGPDYPGSSFVAFQEVILELHARGAILALASKNNAADVFDVLDRHPHQLLRREHFAATRIDWRDKATSIEELATEINIGLDSMVFIDDSPAECEFVRDRHPNVSVFLTPSDPLLLREFAHKLRSFDSVDVTGEDLERGRQYLSQSARQSEERRHATLDEFLASLQMRIEITTPTPQDVARVAQLTQKTNQFNLTTRRYTDAAIEHMLTSGEKRVYQARVSDKYGSYGIVSVVIFEIVADQLVLDNILMSCRIIGRKVEAALMAFLVKIARESGVTRIVGERISTAKNAPTVNLFRDFNFELIEATDVHELWSLNVEKSNIALPQLFSVTW